MFGKENPVVVAIAPTQSKNNPDYYWAQLKQDRTSIEGNFVRKRAITCIVNGTKEELAGLTLGMQLSGKIVATESLEPVNPDNLEQGIKFAGDSGIKCTVNGQPIYRSTMYTEDLSATDTLVKHDNGDAISAHYVEKRAQEEANLDA